jgi:hypothetical protein
MACVSSALFGRRRRQFGDLFLCDLAIAPLVVFRVAIVLPRLFAWTYHAEKNQPPRGRSIDSAYTPARHE